jgi:hypothetical protein
MIKSTLAVEFDEQKIDAIFSKVDQSQLPGAAVGIAIGGRPVYRKGFGLASMVSVSPVAVSLLAGRIGVGGGMGQALTAVCVVTSLLAATTFAVGRRYFPAARNQRLTRALA